ANPTLLLLDEPAAGLNSTEKLELHELLKRIAAQGLTILIIDHDMTLVSEAAQHITVLNFGRRIADGESMAGLRHPDVVSAYLGSGRGRWSKSADSRMRGGGGRPARRDQRGRGAPQRGPPPRGSPPPPLAKSCSTASRSLASGR